MGELERIRQQRMRELMNQLGKQSTQEELSWPNAPIQVMDATFASTIKKYPLIVIDCWAPWCAPCRMMAPSIDALAKDHAGEIVFGKLNVDENQEVAVKYGIMSIPTLLVFKNGTLVKRIVGAVPRQHIEQIIEEER
ncbi:MAG: thioredoxin [Methanocellales archaeon]|nr:thioredoxin [Methanocellales archaeon]